MSEQLHVQQSVSGFIASAPQLSYTDRGDARFYLKIGQEHFTRNDDGGHSYVYKQPENPEEEALCKEAMEGCPVEAIGNDGE